MDENMINVLKLFLGTYPDMRECMALCKDKPCVIFCDKPIIPGILRIAKGDSLKNAYAKIGQDVNKHKEDQLIIHTPVTNY